METVRSSILNFWETNQSQLNNFYPGLQAHRLIKEISVNVPYGFSSEEDFLVSPVSNWKEKKRIFKDLSTGIPLGHIFQQSYFYKSTFKVNEKTLIPRVETEILVEMAVEFAKKSRVQKIADIGTGSGCILLSILAELDFPVEATFVDIDKEALEIAKSNSIRLKNQIHSQTKLEFINSDRFQNVNGSFSLIVSNPPYIPRDAKLRPDSVHHQVDKYEPELALYLPQESYQDWFKDLFSQIDLQLAPRGLFIMEGHEDKLDELKLIASTVFNHEKIEIKKDLTNRSRFLVFYKA